MARTNTSAIDALDAALQEVGRTSLIAQEGVSRRVSSVISAIADEASTRRRALAAARARLQAASEPGEVAALSRAVAHAERRVAAARRAERLATQASVRTSSATARFGREIPSSVSEAQRIITGARQDVDSYLGGPHAVSSRTSESNQTVSAGDVIPGGGDVRLVSLAQVDTSDREITSGDFGKGYSPADLRWATNALHEVVMPALAVGHGADYFRRRDATEERMGTRSYSDTYSGFFGADDAIRLSHTGGRYHVENGYHRIWVARQMGMTHVPARIAE